MLYTKIQPQFWRRRFLSVLPYMGMAVILLNGAEPFKHTVNILDPIDVNYVKSSENCSSCFRKEDIF